MTPLRRILALVFLPTWAVLYLAVYVLRIHIEALARGWRKG